MLGTSQCTAKAYETRAMGDLCHALVHGERCASAGLECLAKAVHNPCAGIGRPSDKRGTPARFPADIAEPDRSGDERSAER